MGREGAGGQGEKKVLVTWPVLAWWMRHWWIRFAATEEFHSCPNWLGKEGAAGNKYPSLCLLCSLNLCWSHPCLIITGREGRVARVRPHRAASLGSVGRELRVDLGKGANKTQSAQLHLFLHWFPSSYFRPLIFRLPGSELPLPAHLPWHINTLTGICFRCCSEGRSLQQ